jgi:hypothetical protein
VYDPGVVRQLRAVLERYFANSDRTCYLKMFAQCEDYSEHSTADGFVFIAENVSFSAGTRVKRVLN